MKALMGCGTVAIVSWLVAAFSTGTPPVALRAHGALDIAWHVAGSARGTPAVLDGTVYFLSKHHELIALAKDSGRLQWTASIGARGPTTAGARVIAARDLVVAGDTDLVAFDREGVRRWRFSSGDDDGPGVYLGDADRHRVFTGSTSGRVYAVDLASGGLQWTGHVTGTDAAVVFAPVVSGDLVIAGFTVSRSQSAGLVALDAATGLERWRVAAPFVGEAGQPLPLAGGPLGMADALLATSGDGRIHRVDRVSGSRRGSWPPITAGPGGTTVEHDFRPLARAGSLLVAGSLAGTVVAYDMVTRRERWRRTPQSSSVAFGIAADERAVYIPYLSGRLVVLDATDGREIGRSPEGLTGFAWAPVSADGFVFAASSTDGYFSFRIPTRKWGI